MEETSHAARGGYRVGRVRPRSAPAPRDRPPLSRYDSTAIALHWTTVILVVALYSLGMVWGFFTKATKDQLVAVHVSLGVFLAGLLAVRIFWRLTFAARLPPVESGLMGLAEKLGQFALYVLLIATVGLGFCKHWAAAGQASFFGLLAIPSPFPMNDHLSHQLLPIHYWAANTLIVFAAGHAALALFHQYAMLDGTLGRMLPLVRSGK